MKIALIVFGVIICIGVLITVVGSLMPVKHAAERTIELKSSPQNVWALVSDFQNAAGWRQDLKAVEKVQVEQYGTAWKEVSKGGDAITYATLESSPNQRLVRKIIDKNLPFGGTWTFQFESAAGGCRLAIREDGEVYNPLFRFLSKFVFSHHSSMDKYLAQLKSKLGEG